MIQIDHETGMNSVRTLTESASVHECSKVRVECVLSVRRRLFEVAGFTSSVSLLLHVYMYSMMNKQELHGHSKDLCRLDHKYI